MSTNNTTTPVIPLANPAPVAPVTNGPAVASMAATATSLKPVPGSNAAAMRQAWLDKCSELGEQNGAGKAAELLWFEDMVERATPARGEIVPDDAQDGFNAWRAAVDRRSTVKGKVLTKGTKAKAVSEARTMIAWGALPNASAPRVFGFVKSVVNATSALRGEMAEHLLKVARHQLKKPDAPFTKEEIKHLLTSETEKPEKVEVEELAVERKRLQKIGEKFTFSSHLRAAINSLSERIEQLGGTAEEKRQAAKAARTAAKKAAKKKANKA
jgi:hypothetical protein